MEDRNLRCSRRKFMASAVSVTLAGGVASAAVPTPPLALARPGRVPVQGRKPLAVLTTVCRPMSYSYHVLGRFLHGYPREGQLHVPDFAVYSLCVEQTPENDLARPWGREFGFRVTRSVSEALLEQGQLAVEGVLILAEHGNYPRNDKGQILYPRYEMMQQVVEAFRQAGRSVPVFCSNHLSYSFEKAQRMVHWSKELSFGLMAGSSLPVTWRRPELEPGLDTPFQDALVAAYGPLEVFGFHALEALQVMLERRRGGETGVKAVTCLVGKDVWKAGDAGLWSWDLLEAALARSETVNPGDVRRNVGSFAVGTMPAIPPTAFLIEYRDGQRGCVLLLNGHVQDVTFAGKIAGQDLPASCLFVLPPPPGARHLEAQVRHVENFLARGVCSISVERTLLTTGILDALMESHQRRGMRIETPHLNICYNSPADSGFIRAALTETA